MNELFVFLRRVVPRGKNAVKMTDVRQVLGDKGFDDVRSWIQSSDIALRTDLDSTATAARIESLLLAHLQVDLPVIIAMCFIELASFPHLPNNALATGGNIIKLVFVATPCCHARIPRTDTITI